MRYPLFYDFTTAGTSLTTVSTLHETLDHSRAFRVAAVRGKITAYKYPVFVQFEVYGQSSQSDNVWATEPTLVPVNGCHTFFRRLSASVTGWFPSKTSEATRLCQLVNICSNAATVGCVKASVVLTIAMGPFEPSDSCPGLRLQPFIPLQSLATGPSATQGSASDWHGLGGPRVDGASTPGSFVIDVGDSDEDNPP